LVAAFQQISVWQSHCSATWNGIVASLCRIQLRILLIAICLGLSCGFATGQADPKKDINTTTGRAAPAEKGQLQPQGWTGPLDTKSGGAPAESPQGQSPPGMQPAPDGSTKTAVEPDK
jgi:hypothetical protein